MWHDRSILLERGHVVTAEVVEFHGGTRGTSVTVRFTTIAGEEVVTRMKDPPSGQSPDPGAHPQIRYDPDDPSGRVMPTNENQAIAAQWLRAGGAPSSYCEFKAANRRPGRCGMRSSWP